MICGGTTFAEKFCFQTYSPNLVLFSRVALRSPKFLHSLSGKFGGVDASFSIWICERMTLPENVLYLLSIVQLTLTCFQMWFVNSLKDLHQMLKWNRKSNSNFLDVNLPKERSVQKIILFSLLPERLLIFKYGDWAQTVLLWKYKFNSENIMYCVWYHFANEGQRPCHIRDVLSRKYFRFRHCSTNVVLFSKTVSENAQTFTSNVKSKCEGRL